MKWLAKWTEETNPGKYADFASYLRSWEEVMGFFLSWLPQDSNVVKGAITCYLGDDPYGDGRPCLTYDITDGTEGEE